MHAALVMLRWDVHWGVPMPSIMTSNWINVQPGDPAFVIATNVCDWFELGSKQGADYWLEGQIVGNDEFLFNGRLFLPEAAVGGTIIDSFPHGPAPRGWVKRPRADDLGYDLVSQDGIVLFGYRVENHLCVVTVNLYAADGGLVAESLPNEFRLHRHPAMIGRGGIHFA